MFIEFKTIITHRIDLGDGGIEGISHSVSVAAGEAAALGNKAVLIISRAGCEATIKAIDSDEYTVEREVDPDEDEDKDESPDAIVLTSPTHPDGYQAQQGDHRG